MGKELKTRKYVRNPKGEFVPEKRTQWWMLYPTVAYLAFMASMSPSEAAMVSFNEVVPVAQAAEEAPIPVVMQRVADCESGGGKPGKAHQFNKDGSVVMNVNKTAAIDAGYFQINLSPEHVREATRLGFDLFTEEGNKAYALYLFDREGTSPWLSSASCWRR